MNRSLRALMCAALTVCMVLTLFVIPAAAEDNLVQGDCGAGETMQWTLQDGTLTISPGTMKNYGESDLRWVPTGEQDSRSGYIETVVFEKVYNEETGETEGATNIGSYAFADCTSLTTITIPDTVTTIGDHAFDNCSELKTFSIPVTVTELGGLIDNIFDNCSLTEITYEGSRTQWTALLQRLADDNGESLENVEPKNITVVCSDDTTAFATIDAVSLSLNGTLDLNFYVTTADVGDINATFKCGDDTAENVKPVEKNGQYVYTYSVAAKDMDTDVTLTLISEEGTEVSCTYSVKKYIESARKVHSSNTKLIALFDATSDYGAWAKYYFGGGEEQGMDKPLSEEGTLSEAFNDPSAVAAGVKDALSGLKPTTDGKSDNLTLSSVSLVLESTTTMRFQFSPAEGKAMDDVKECKFAGKFNTDSKVNGDYVYVDITGITATDLDEDFTVTADGLSITASPLSYVQAVLNDESQSEELQSLVTALYLYNQAADAYFKA